jgi:predicted membrane channel-forming protein YqfA (hemolysin III family)
MIVAAIGAKALYLLFAWLIITIICQYLAERKGYGTRWGLATGLIFPPGVIVWLFMPPKPGSDWKVLGPFGGSRIDEDDAADPQAGRTAKGGAGPTGAAG